MKNKPEIATGRYQHYKGAFYQVIDVAAHSETEEWMVLYRPEYGNQDLWVRPFEMFFEDVKVDGVLTPRFKLVS